jgi:hypothetical protein
MNNRLEIAKNILNNQGSFYLHLDENANFLGRLLFEDFNFSEIKEITFHTMAATDEGASTFGMKNVSSQNFVQESQTIYYGRYEKHVFHKLWKPNRRVSKLGIGSLDLIANLKPNGSKKSKDNYDFVIEKYENEKLVECQIQQAQTEKIYTMGDIWNDILSMSQSSVRQYGENISFQGQKPESLIRRIIQASTNQRDFVFDFFAGTGTTAAVAHKMSRKWITIEQGGHFKETYEDIDEKGNKVIKVGCIGRLKIVLNGDKGFYVPNSEHRRGSILSKDINWNGGGFFKYYSLETYKDTLNKMLYVDINDGLWAAKNKEFSTYIFGADKKLADVIKYKANGDINLDIDKLYKDIDWAETISNLKGLPIKKIKSDSVVFENGEEIKTNFTDMNNHDKAKFLETIKPLIWWGE